MSVTIPNVTPAPSTLFSSFSSLRLRHYRWPIALIVSIAIWLTGLLLAAHTTPAWLYLDITTAAIGMITGLAWGSVGLWVFLQNDQPTLYTKRAVIQAIAIAVLLTQGLVLQASWASIAVGYLVIKAIIGLSLPKKRTTVPDTTIHHDITTLTTGSGLLLSVAWLTLASLPQPWMTPIVTLTSGWLWLYGLAVVGYAYTSYRLFYWPIATPSVGLTGWGLVIALDVLLYATALLATLQPFSLTSASSSSVIETVLLVLLAHTVILNCIEQWKRCIGSFSNQAASSYGSPTTACGFGR